MSGNIKGRKGLAQFEPATHLKHARMDRERLASGAHRIKCKGGCRFSHETVMTAVKRAQKRQFASALRMI